MGGPRRIARIAQAGEALQELRAELRTQLLFSLQPAWQRNQGLGTQKELRYKRNLNLTPDLQLNCSVTLRAGLNHPWKTGSYLWIFGSRAML